MELGLKGKAAIVGGASRGIGKAIAMALAQEGAQVAICARGRTALESVAHEMGASVDVLPVVADLSQPDQTKRVVRETVERFGRLDIMVCNTGGPPVGGALEMSEEGWRLALEQNLMAFVRMSQEAIPHMRQRGWGRIVNILSTSVKQPIAGLVLSNATRLGVVGYARTLADEVGRDGITVNNVCPGRILTGRLRQVLQAGAEREGRSLEEAMSGAVGSIPLGRLGSPQEVAALVVFLASEQASYITGTTIAVDGGALRAIF